MHAEAIGILQDIERRCDTNALAYRGVSYWPVCRLRLWTELMRRMVVGKKSGEAVANTGPTWPDVGQVNAELAGAQNLGLLRTAKNAGGLSPKALFFLRPEEYMDKANGKAFAKVIDSIYERAAAKHSATKIELAEVRTMCFQRAYPSLFLNLQLAGADVKFDAPGELANFAAVADAVTKTDGTLKLDQAGLLTDMGKIFYFACIFEKLLRTLGPKALILSVYYHPVGMAWMLACRRAGVKSIDLQHGRLGPHHGLYTQLTAAPPDGYHLLPDAIWCWGDETKRAIEVDKNPACARHGGIVGGNAWMHKWRFGDTIGLEPPEAKAFADKTADRRRILVSLQPLESPVTPALLEAMRQSPPEWLWLLRLHPLRRQTAPAIAAILKNAGITNAEIETATSLPLFTLLKISTHHVTVFSSVAVEAAAFGVATSLLGEEGAAAFAPQVARGACRYTPTPDALLGHIREVLSGPRLEITDDFMDMREGLVDDTLAQLLA